MKRRGFRKGGWHHARGMPDQPRSAPRVCTCGHDAAMHGPRETACMEIGCRCEKFHAADAVVSEAAADVVELRVVRRDQLKHACDENGVQPHIYGRAPDDYEGAWDDYVEERLVTIIARVAKKLSVERDEADALVYDAVQSHPRYLKFLRDG